MSRPIARSTRRSTLLALIALVTVVAARPAAAQRGGPSGGPLGRPTGWPERRTSLDGRDTRAFDVGGTAMSASGKIALGSFALALLHGSSRRQAGTALYAGSVAGATLGAYASSGPREGCIRRGRGSRLARSAAAALVGVAPAMLYVGTRHDGYSSTGFWFGLSTPLSQGIAAAVLLPGRCGDPA